jgi:hypothetical protein
MGKSNGGEIMFTINLFLASLVCGAAGILLDLSDALSAAGKFLYRPLPRAEAEHILGQADPEKLAQALKTIRSALRGDILAPRFPFEDRNPAEVAIYPDEILLDLYIGEIAGMLDPLCSVPTILRTALADATRTQVHLASLATRDNRMILWNRGRDHAEAGDSVVLPHPTGAAMHSRQIARRRKHRLPLWSMIKQNQKDRLTTLSYIGRFAE